MKKLLPSLWLFAVLCIPRVLAADPMAPVDSKTYSAPVKLACVGDSITQGKPDGNYPDQLQALLGDSWQVKNFGHSGHTLLKKGDRPYWRSKKYEAALAFKPDVVIIKLGTNDTKDPNWKFKDEFVADYTALIESFSALDSKPRIFLCRPCPVFGKGAFGIKESGIQEEIIWLNDLAKKLQLGLIDMHAPLADKPELVPDNVHPNSAGYGVMAATAYTTLTGKPAPQPAAK